MISSLSVEKSLSKNKHNIACAMYVVSHHCSDYNAIEISKFLKLCKQYKVPTIIDAASEEYMEEFFKIGADIAIFSAHKFMGSLTAGILAGKKKICKKYLSTKFRHWKRNEGGQRSYICSNYWC